MAKTKVHGEYLDPSVISGQTQVTAVGANSVLTQSLKNKTFIASKIIDGVYFDNKS